MSTQIQTGNNSSPPLHLRRTSTTDEIQSTSSHATEIANSNEQVTPIAQSNMLPRQVSNPSGHDHNVLSSRVDGIIDAAKKFDATKSKGRDWLKIAGLIIAITSGVFLVFAGLCAAGIFPPEFLGGGFGLGISFTAGSVLFTTGGSILFYRWNVPQKV